MPIVLFLEGSFGIRETMNISIIMVSLILRIWIMMNRFGSKILLQKTDRKIEVHSEYFYYSDYS
ncbi:hypothetical protein DOT_2488 [Desulfosporosinus sp. OT]|nr:hypothetical protein DOT_2488 [Desulfosporosinus sp. OT]